MKFSYSYLKKLVPAIRNVSELSEKLTMGLFEIDGVDGDTIDVKVLPNRYSDAASHVGLAREISAFYGKKFNEPKADLLKPKAKGMARVFIKDKLRCRRAAAWYFEGVVIGSSPKWMQEVLVACGMRPINNLVDITNFVMLETGQPLHAFDLDLMDSEDLIIRRAENNEKITTLDNREFSLDSDMLVLADKKSALDVAGIKGGKKAEVTETTTRILLTACSFDGISIYKTQRKLNLMTDASLRFAHHLSPELVSIGISRAGGLIAQLCKGVPGKLADIRAEKQVRRSILLDDERINKLLGIGIKRMEMVSILQRIGFVIKGRSVTVPLLRDDVRTLEDLAEEVARFYGYEKIVAKPLLSYLFPRMSEGGSYEFRESVRDALVGYGFDEVYNYSFTDADASEVSSFFQGEAHELLNPISDEQTHLRTSLTSHVCKNLGHNLKFFESVNVFEVGRVYLRRSGNDLPAHEVNVLCVAMASKKRERAAVLVFELKGVIYDLLSRYGCTDIVFQELDAGTTPAAQSVRILVNQKILGYLGLFDKSSCVAELDLDVLQKEMLEERAYKVIPKYPAVVRDISILVSQSLRIGKVMESIELSNDKLIADVDLVDEYSDPTWKDKQSITFRIVFQSEEKTLTSEEVDAEMKSITGMLQTAFHAEIR